MDSLHLLHHDYFVHEPTGQWYEWLKEQIYCIHKMGHSIHLIIKVLFCWDHLLVSIHKRHNHLYILHSYGKIYPRTSSQRAWSHFPVMFLPSLWPYHWLSAMNCCINAQLAIFASKCPVLLSALSFKDFLERACSVIADNFQMVDCTVCRTICKSDFSLLFFCQLMMWIP